MRENGREFRREDKITGTGMGFESGVVKSLAEMFPKHRARLKDITERLVDPLPIIRSHVYDPQFHGSFSIKTVAPALLGKSASYDGMAVGDGGDAQVAYLCLIDPKTDPTEKERLRKALLEYCRKDTLGMVELVEWLFHAAKTKAA
jgi:predicted RecB family nuclease